MMAAKTRLALDWILIGIYSLYRLLHPSHARHAPLIVLGIAVLAVSGAYVATNWPLEKKSLLSEGLSNAVILAATTYNVVVVFGR